MLHANNNYNPEEIKVLRELEYDLFMFNPGFRSMWNNNFDEYFTALFDENKWNKKQEERMQVADENISTRMIKDPEFAKFMRDQSIIDNVLMGDMRIEHAPFELQQEIRQIMKESEDLDTDYRLNEMLGINTFPESVLQDPWERDPLFNMAFEWGEELGKKAIMLYEDIKNIELFRIANNCPLVASKLIGALSETDFGGVDFEWREDRIGYTLSLTSLNRSIDSLQKLETQHEVTNKLNTANFLKTAKVIRSQLIERLDSIVQEKLKKLK